MVIQGGFVVNLEFVEGWIKAHVGIQGVYIKIDRQIDRQVDRLDTLDRLDRLDQVRFRLDEIRLD